MGHLVKSNELHLFCNNDLDCNAKILNSYCDHNSTSCMCERGYRYNSKINKCVFSNHFSCNDAKTCAELDFRLTCVSNHCTCKEKDKRTDQYLCKAFKNFCYRGYRYNVETTDCVFVGDMTINQLENLDQSVEIFVVVLFFITSALFIASCINNYQNERREKLRRRIAQQQTMSLFAEQRRLNMTNSPSITEVVSLAGDNLFANANGQRNGSSRHSTARNQPNRHYRYEQNMIDCHKPFTHLEDLPPSYEDLFPKNEELPKFIQINPLDSDAHSTNYTTIEQQSSNENSITPQVTANERFDSGCCVRECNTNFNHNSMNNGLAVIGNTVENASSSQQITIDSQNKNDRNNSQFIDVNDVNNNTG